MADHVTERVDSTMEQPVGLLHVPGTLRFRQTLANREAAPIYDKWAGDEMGKMVVRTLRDLALHAPKEPSNSDIQYGISLGLSMAAQLIEDPSTVFPTIFNANNQRPPTVIPAPSFSVRPEDT